jgi:hypothetical protein
MVQTIPIPNSLTLNELLGCNIVNAEPDFAVLSIGFTGGSSMDCTSSAKKLAFGKTPSA